MQTHLQPFFRAFLTGPEAIRHVRVDDVAELVGGDPPHYLLADMFAVMVPANGWTHLAAMIEAGWLTQEIVENGGLSTYIIDKGWFQGFFTLYKGGLIPAKGAEIFLTHALRDGDVERVRTLHEEMGLPLPADCLNTVMKNGHAELQNYLMTREESGDWLLAELNAAYMTEDRQRWDELLQHDSREAMVKRLTLAIPRFPLDEPMAVLVKLAKGEPRLVNPVLDFALTHDLKDLAFEMLKLERNFPDPRGPQATAK